MRLHDGFAGYKISKLTDEGGNYVDNQGTDGPDVGDVARHHPPDSVGDPCKLKSKLEMNPFLTFFKARKKK